MLKITKEYNKRFEFIHSFLACLTGQVELHDVVTYVGKRAYERTLSELRAWTENYEDATYKIIVNDTTLHYDIENVLTPYCNIEALEYVRYVTEEKFVNTKYRTRKYMSWNVLASRRQNMIVLVYNNILEEVGALMVENDNNIMRIKIYTDAKNQ